jgi:hypothetical protein
MIIYLLLLLSASATKLKFKTEPPATTVSGTTMTVFVVQLVADDATTPELTPNIEIKLFPESADSEASGTMVQKTDAAGEAKFNDIIGMKVGAGYKWTAISDSIDSVDSQAFAVTEGAMQSLSFTTQPGGPHNIGAAFTTTVTAVDDYGNTVTTYALSVTLTLYSDAASTALSGTASNTASSGVAAFTGLSVDKAGTMYLEATSGNFLGHFS